MVRKLSITLHDDGMATVEGEIGHKYPSYEKGVEVLQLIVLSLSGNPLKKTTVIPTGPEDLGACQECETHGKNFEKCDACVSPVPEKMEPVKKETEKKHKIPTNSCADTPSWLTKELDVIKDCKTIPDAWAAFQIAFPGQRNRNAIDQRWRKLKKAEMPVKPPAKAPVKETAQKKIENLAKIVSGEKTQTTKSAILAKNSMADRWSDAEKDLLRINPVFEDTWIRYQVAFPDSKRNRSTVQQRWNKLNPLNSRKSTTKTLVKSTKLVVASTEGVKQSIEAIALSNEMKEGSTSSIEQGITSIPPVFKINDHVKQIKKYHDRQMSGIGVVTSIKNGLIEVNFRSGQYYKIAPDCLEGV